MACFNLGSSVFSSGFFRFHPLFSHHKLPLLFSSEPCVISEPWMSQHKIQKNAPIFTSHSLNAEVWGSGSFFCFSWLSFPNRLFTVFSLSSIHRTPITRTLGRLLFPCVSHTPFCIFHHFWSPCSTLGIFYWSLFQLSHPSWRCVLLLLTSFEE